MALDPSQEIFDESEVSDCGSMVVEPPTSPRSWSLASTPSPAPRSPTPDAMPDPVAETAGSHLAPEYETARKRPTPHQDSALENEVSNKAADREDETHITLPSLASVSDRQTSSAMPEFPGQPFLFDFEIPYLTASPDELESTQKRSRDDFESDLNTILDPDLFGDQGLGIRVPEESEHVLHQVFPPEGNLEARAGASTALKTDCPEGRDGEGEKRKAKSPKVESCKRRKI